MIQIVKVITEDEILHEKYQKIYILCRIMPVKKIVRIATLHFRSRTFHTKLFPVQFQETLLFHIETFQTFNPYARPLTVFNVCTKHCA